MKKKIVLTIPDFCTGGAEKMVAEIASGLDKDLYDVTVLVIRKPLGNAIEQSISKDVHIVYLNKEMGFDLITLFECNRVLKSIVPDIIHTHIQSFMYCLLFIMTNNVKMLHTIHNIPEEESKGIRRKVLAFLFKNNKAIPVGISDKISLMTNVLYGISTTETVYNPVDEKVFYPLKECKDNSETIKFISVGRLVEQKNFKLLVNSFHRFSKLFPKTELNILGDGPLKDELISQVRDLNADNIHFLGNKSNVADYMRAADVFILTSKFEGLPMTILEAMSVGLPVICTDVGGVCDIIDGNGILIKNQEEDEVVDSLSKMMNKDERRTYANMSIKLSKRYYLQNIVMEYENLYSKYSR